MHKKDIRGGRRRPRGRLPPDHHLPGSFAGLIRRVVDLRAFGTGCGIIVTSLSRRTLVRVVRYEFAGGAGARGRANESAARGAGGVAKN